MSDRALVSLQTRLFVWLCGPLTVLWCAGLLAAYSLTERMVGLAFDQSLLDTALTLSTQIRGNDGKALLDLSENDERMLLFDPVDVTRYAVLAEDGALLSGMRDVPRPANSVAPGKPVFYDAMMDAQPMRWVAVVTEQMDEDDPKPIRAMIVAGKTLRKREALSWQTLYLASLPQLGLVAMLAAMVWFGLRRGLRPLRELRQRLHERSEADLHPIAIDSKAREIDALLDAVNMLMVRLDHALAVQSEFIGNAAHQLRTPLAALKARVEYAGRERAIGRDTLAELGQSADRCIHLVNQLLALAQVDATHSRALTWVAVDVVLEVRELVADMIDQALAKGIDLGVETTAESLFVVTDVTLLRELLRNLVDNALRYTPPCGRVTVGLEDAAGHVVVSVSDSGPGIAANERARIFERFYRGDNTPATGSGLGLSIARRCATVIGAELSLVPTARGACFRVTLPRERRASAV